MKIKLFLLLTFFLCRTAFAIDYIELIDSYNKKLAAKTQKIKETKQAIQKKQKLEKQLYKKITDLDRAIVRIRRELKKIEKKQDEKQQQINELEAEIRNLRAELKKNEAELDEITARLERQEKLFKKRIIMRYKIGRWWALKFVFLSSDFEELTKRVELLNILSEEDYKLIQDIKKNKARKKELIEKLRVEKEKYDNLLKIRQIEYNDIVKLLYSKRKKLDSLKLARYEKQKNLKRLRADRRNLENTLKRLRSDAKNLKNMITKFEKEAIKKGNFAKLKGRLPWPVEGEIVTRFGKQVIDPVGGSVIYSDGIDISAPLGTEVRAVNKGKVLYSDVNGIYGLMVIISHGYYYYTIYSHLADAYVNVGDEVEGGDVIGTVGMTGYTEKPVLHFEIRLKEKPLNPLNWLRRRRK